MYGQVACLILDLCKLIVLYAGGRWTQSIFMTYILCCAGVGCCEWKYIQNFGGVTSYKWESRQHIQYCV